MHSIFQLTRSNHAAKGVPMNTKNRGHLSGPDPANNVIRQSSLPSTNKVLIAPKGVLLQLNKNVIVRQLAKRLKILTNTKGQGLNR